MDTPYRPPTAAVVDMPLSMRRPPPHAARGIFILYVSLGIGVLGVFPSAIPEFWPNMQSIWQDMPWLIVVMFAALCLMAGVQGLFIWMCYRGKRWARTVLLWLTMVSLCFLVVDFIWPEDSTTFLLFLSAVCSFFDCVGLCFLFTPSSRQWFLEGKT